MALRPFQISHAQRVDIDFGICGHNDQQRHVIPRRRSSHASPSLSNGAISNGIASVCDPLLDCAAGLGVAQKFSTNKDLGPDRFAALDRSESTLFEALRLLKDLLIITPRILHYVLDGAQLCEDDKEDVVGTGMYLNYFIDIMQQSREDKITKVLFTTDGLWRRLSLKLDPGEQVYARQEDQGAARQEGHGRVSLAELRISDQVGAGKSRLAVPI